MTSKVSANSERDNGGRWREGGRQSWRKHGVEVCPICKGTGLITSSAWEGRARKGGIRSFLVSLEPGHLSMSQRGKYGGRPKALKTENIEERREAAPGPTPYMLGAPPPHYNTG